MRARRRSFCCFYHRFVQNNEHEQVTKANNTHTNTKKKMYTRLKCSLTEVEICLFSVSKKILLPKSLSLFSVRAMFAHTFLFSLHAIHRLMGIFVIQYVSHLILIEWVRPMDDETNNFNNFHRKFINLVLYG